MAGMKTLRLAAVASLLVGVIAAPPPTAAAVAGYNLQLPTAPPPSGFSISGHVRDSHAVGLAGADVEVCAALDDCSAGYAQTDGSGAFSVVGVAAGSYYVQSLAPFGANAVGVWYDGDTGSPDSSVALQISVSADIPSLDLVEPDGLRITGRVTNSHGDPVAGVNVTPSGTGSGVASDSNGDYQVVGLLSGDETLTVAPPETGQYLHGYFAGGTVVKDGPGDVVAVLASDVTGLNVQLVDGLTISGHVAGVAGRPVQVVTLESDYQYPGVVDGSGNFTVPGLWPGSYHLLFAVPEDPSYPYGLYNGPGKTIVTQNEPGVAVDATLGSVTGLDAILNAMPSLSGTVRDVNGPVAGATLVVCGGSVSGCSWVHSHADGSWIVRNAPPDAFTIIAGDGSHGIVGYAAGRSVPDQSKAVPIVVGTSSASGIGVMLPLGATVSGTITGPGGVPIQGAIVSVRQTTGGISEFGPGGTFTDANGHFAVRGLVPGSYKMSVDPADGSGLAHGCWSTGGFVADCAAATVITITDTAKPAVTAPVAGFTVGATLGTSTVPVRLGWTSKDPGTNVKADRLQQKTGAGSWTTVASPVTPSVTRSLKPSSTTTYRFQANATDYAGNTSSWAVGATFKVAETQQSAAAVHYTGSWSSTSSSSASGGSFKWTGSKGSATYAFTGRAIGWVATVGASYGSARVYLDGKLISTVSTNGPSTGYRRIVFAHTWSSSAAHTIKIVGLATAGHPRVALDGFVVLR